MELRQYILTFFFDCSQNFSYLLNYFHLLHFRACIRVGKLFSAQNLCSSSSNFKLHFDFVYGKWQNKNTHKIHCLAILFVRSDVFCSTRFCVDAVGVCAKTNERCLHLDYIFFFSFFLSRSIRLLFLFILKHTYEAESSVFAKKM